MTNEQVTARGLRATRKGTWPSGLFKCRVSDVGSTNICEQVRGCVDMRIGELAYCGAAGWADTHERAAHQEQSLQRERGCGS